MFEIQGNNILFFGDVLLFPVFFFNFQLQKSLQSKINDNFEKSLTIFSFNAETLKRKYKVFPKLFTVDLTK